MDFQTKYGFRDADMEVIKALAKFRREYEATLDQIVTYAMALMDRYDPEVAGGDYSVEEHTQWVLNEVFKRG